MIEHVKLKVSYDGQTEWLINEDTNEILVEGSPLKAEDVLWALGYRFAIEIDPDIIRVSGHPNAIQHGGPCRFRTYNPSVNSRVLYR